MATETTALEVCSDCLFWLANGEVTDSNGDDITAAHVAKMVTVWGEGFDITPGSIGADDGEAFFSWRQCDGCGSTLGGDRHSATAWVEVPRTAQMAADALSAAGIGWQWQQMGGNVGAIEVMTREVDGRTEDVLVADVMSHLSYPDGLAQEVDVFLVMASRDQESTYEGETTDAAQVPALVRAALASLGVTS
jgi:hypothetical protein